LDSITDLAYGAPFGYLEKDEDLHDFVKTIHGHLPILGILGTVPWLARIANNKWVRSVTGPFPTDDKGIGKVLGYVRSIRIVPTPNIDIRPCRLAKDVVAERFGPHKIDRQDMLSSFIRNGLTQKEAQVEVVTQMSICLPSLLIILEADHPQASQAATQQQQQYG
jgi:hypothetical protein